jgi:LuxR family maltose regulon positive regulatory protein
VLRAARGPLTSLTAPAGYGKTFLIDHWAAAHRGRPLVRVDLSRHAHAGGGRATDVLDDAVEQADGSILVVDGLDAPIDPLIGAVLDRVITDGPSNVRVLVARRSRGFAAVDSRLARGVGTEIAADELAFTPDEAALLVYDVAGVELSDDQLAGVMARTEGWAAGLVLLARLLDEAADPAPVIAGFTGEDRHVAAFLNDRVLARLPDRQRNFLLRTSVLERLDGPSCAALTGDPASGAMLDLLERHGLFLRRTDARTETFTYHPLFRELLRRELRLSAPGAESESLVVAARWHIGNDEPESAARCLVDAERPDLLVELGDRYGRAMFEAGRPGDVLRWLESVADDSGPDPELTLRRAYLHTMLGETPQAGQLLHDLPTRALTPGQRLAVDGLRATWVFFDGRPADVIVAADAVLDAIDDIDDRELPDIYQLTTRSSLWTMATVSRARAEWSVGQIAEARVGLATVLERDDVYPTWLVHTLSASAMLEAWAGDLHVASALAQRAMRFAGRAGLSAHPATLDARLALACVHREAGELRRARSDLDGAVAIAAHTRRPITNAIAAVEVARWHLADGSVDQGLALLEKHGTEGVVQPLLVEQHLVAAEIRLLLALGEVERARSVLDRAGRPLPGTLRATAVHVAIAGGDHDGPRALLEDWDQVDAPSRERLDHALWRAVLEMETGDRRAAVRLGSPVATDAVAAGRLRLFADAGPSGERLLRALARDPEATVARRLLQPASPPTTPLTPVLSDREREVVRYLPTALSSAEIAGQLYISLNTLKTHLHSIYRKLDVHGRSEAIERAKELGLA